MARFHVLEFSNVEKWGTDYSPLTGSSGLEAGLASDLIREGFPVGHASQHGSIGSAYPRSLREAERRE